jgi:metal-sulfur cluster biosynthetic enzyme
MMKPPRITPEQVRSCLESIIDPQWGISIVDLGLLYGIRAEENRIEIDITLTSPDDPKVGTIASEVEQAVRAAFEEIDDVEVGLVWDPPWTFERLTEKGRQALGYEE